MTSTPAHRAHEQDAPRPTTTFTARSPEDVLAAVPVVLGFHPEHSAVMLTFGAERSFHARVDLPPVTASRSARALDLELATCLVEPARRQRVRSVVLVLYSGDESAAERLSRCLRREFARAGIDVVDVLRAHGNRWYALGTRRSGVPAWGVPYDISNHRFRAQSVLDGLVTHGSRTELAATLATDPAQEAALAAAVAAWRHSAGAHDATHRAALDAALDAAGAAAVVDRHLASGRVPDDELAPLLLAIRDLSVRDAVWSPITRADARDHVRLWTDAVRRAPSDLLPGAAAVLAFAAWVAGHGALAWCAVDRCWRVEPDNSLARLVADLLSAAVPPGAWHEPVQGTG